METLLPTIPFNSPELGRAWIIRIDPSSDFIADLLEPTQYDLALWLIYNALNDKHRKPLTAVWRYLQAWADEMDPSLVLISSLLHRRTPFGIGYHNQYLAPEYGYQMLVVYRGELLLRDRRGVLRPTGQRVWS